MTEPPYRYFRVSDITEPTYYRRCLGHVIEVVRRQDDRLRAAFWPPERAEEAIAKARDVVRTSTLTYQQVVDRAIDDEARAQARRTS